MAEQVETTGAVRPLNKALWMQALDVLEREFVESAVLGLQIVAARHDCAYCQ